MPTDNTKVIIHVYGDHTVGESGGEITIDFGEKLSLGPAALDDMQREDLRHIVQGFAFDYLQDRPHVIYFSDECFDCGSLLIDGECSNSKCISNAPEGED